MKQATEYYELVLEVLEAPSKSQFNKIKELRKLLQIIATDATANEPVQFANLFSRIDYIRRKKNLSKEVNYRIGSFRYFSKSQSGTESISEGEFYGYCLAIAQYIEQLCESPIPDTILSLTSKASFKQTTHLKTKEFIKYVKGHVWEVAELRIIINSEDEEQFIISKTDESLVAYSETLLALQAGDKVSLLDVRIDENEIAHPLHIVLHPDYLIDISSIAECFQNIGGKAISPWQLYYISKFSQKELTPAIHKGNVANFFLDELMYCQRDEFPLFNELIKRTFSSFPFEYTSLFKSDQELREFVAETEQQFNNLKRVVQLDLASESIKINKDRTILEPAFLCEKIGVQGRLDLMHTDNNYFKIVELKSGKVPFPYNDPEKIGDNHAAQARLYKLLLERVFLVNYESIDAAICYSSASNEKENIRWVPRFLEFDKKILNTRNRIVDIERKISGAADDISLQKIFKDLEFDSLGIQLQPNLSWFRRNFDTLTDSISKLSQEERAYMLAFTRFISTELWYSKLGDGVYGKGHSALWNKEDVGEHDDSDIINNLEVIENNIDDSVHPRITFKRNDTTSSDTFNFRKGDICVLYSVGDNNKLATDGQVFKCSISKEINSQGSLEVVFQYKQNSSSKNIIFSTGHKWALEHDSMDYNFHLMYRGLFKFLSSEPSKRKKLLGIAPPDSYVVSQLSPIKEHVTVNSQSREEQNLLISKAISSKDYFLLVGPPGTGKTRILMKHMVEELFNNSDENILVLAYTNKAVDEISESLEGHSYIRIGSRLGCNSKYHSTLLDVIASSAKNRAELSETLAKCRIFVSTVSSIASKQELFKLKQFGTVIIDEASQILEPQVIGLLSNFKKFILIGDHKQLPAVSMQSKEKAQRFNSLLETIGLKDLRESYFERLLRQAKTNNWDHAHGMLRFQGRMHEEIATFPNHLFYNNRLVSADLAHQKGKQLFRKVTNGLEQFLANRRLLFIPSIKTEGENNKVNEFEAKAAAVIVKAIIYLYENNTGEVTDEYGNKRTVRFNSDKTIGIITPYRNQIATIRKELELSGIHDWANISIDTVERYQGSQRDIIILSLCINSNGQLDFLSSHSVEDEETNAQIDRKLNVALTRAKEQLIVLGNPYFLNNSSLYYKLIQFIKTRGGLVSEGVEGVIKNEIKYNQDYDLNEFNTEGKVYQPELRFKDAFESAIITPIKNHPNTSSYPKFVLGYDIDYNRNVVVEHGRANFAANLISHTAEERVLLYCFYNMRKHYFTQLAIFDTFKEEFLFQLENSKHNFTMFDWGCGPGTCALSLQSFFNSNNKKLLTNYIGIDLAEPMLKMGTTFLKSDLFSDTVKYKLVTHSSKIEKALLDEIFRSISFCMFNFSYFFGNIDNHKAKLLAEELNKIKEQYPLNRYYITFQNSSLEGRNTSYRVFKKTLKSFREVVKRTETVSYKNNELSNYDSSEMVYYEILELA
ncbi:MAG: AAA domain-containing protein [Bacteroidia bacterium]